MAYCYDKAIPHSQFLHWDPVDRAKALAWQAEKGSVCPMCGTAPWQWDESQGGDMHAYEAVPVKCEGCAKKDTAREMMTDEQSKSPGVSISLVPAAVAKRMAQTRARRPRSLREKAGKGGRRSVSK